MFLGSIRCAASTATLNGILGHYGLIALPQDLGSHFDVVSMTRHSDPVVERDLFKLAMLKFEAARADGALPSWQLIS